MFSVSYNKAMRYKVLILVFIFLFVGPEASRGLTERDILIQQIEILKREVAVLKGLILNYHLQGEISSPSYLAINIKDGSLLLEKNSYHSYPIASITKLMTAIIVLENIELEEEIILTEEMLRPYGHSPALYLGVSVKANKLLRATLIQSTNDAAEALSHFMEKEKFIELMNEKAKSIDMNDTFFYDSHGLSLINKSTPQDIAKLLSYIYHQHPSLLEITKDNNFWLPGPTGRLLKFQNINNFYYLPNFIGGKTGYLPQAKQTLASVFKINEKAVALVILYSDNRQADAFKIIRRIGN